MPKDKYSTLGELIYWSYSNLAMAHAGLEKNHLKYNTFHYVIRAKLFKGLKDGSMNIRSLFDDEKVKMNTGNICNYCGSSIKLSLDHMIPKFINGQETADNLVVACQLCNSSKGKKDVFEWAHQKNTLLPLMVIRRYLKLIYLYSTEQDILHINITDLKNYNLPFKPEFIPTSFPSPEKLQINVSPK